MRVSRTQVSKAVTAVFLGFTLPASVALAGNVVFQGVDVPTADLDKRKVLAAPFVTVDGTTYPIGFHTILRSGEKVGNKKGGQPFGTLVDHEGNPLKAVTLNKDRDIALSDDGSSRVSVDNDFSSLIPFGDKLFMISHFESRPGAMYISELKQDSDTGKLSALWTKPIDFSGVKGGWVHCAGSVTPWNSHLGSEEYEPNAAEVDPVTGRIDAYYNQMAAYFGVDPNGTAPVPLNPYDYGWPVEVKVLSDKGATSVTKHYAMGRIALELAYVMPDRRTAYLTDDGTNVGLFMFVADRANDLSAGRLYAAKFLQEAGNEDRGGQGRLNWVDLGSATDAQIGGLIDAGIEFTDIFNKADPDVGGNCPTGFRSINAGHDSSRGHECLQVKPGMEIAASRLETRRYAAMMGATTEWKKMEGITFDPDATTAGGVTGRLYLAMSDITNGMLNNDGTWDKGGPNDIRVTKNNCGVVYALRTRGNRKAIGSKELIDSQFVASYMEPEVVGVPTTYDPSSPYKGNTCDVNGIANPDNVTFMTGYGTLIIGEDTGSGHQNDIVWAYNVKSKALTRIQTTPYGSETTSPYWYPNINGFGYLMSVVQHPYGESDADKYNEGSLEDRGYSGYIGPFPAMGAALAP